MQVPRRQVVHLLPDRALLRLQLRRARQDRQAQLPPFEVRGAPRRRAACLSRPPRAATHAARACAAPPRRLSLSLLRQTHPRHVSNTRTGHAAFGTLGAPERGRAGGRRRGVRRGRAPSSNGESWQAVFDAFAPARTARLVHARARTHRLDAAGNASTPSRAPVCGARYSPVCKPAPYTTAAAGEVGADGAASS